MADVHRRAGISAPRLTPEEIASRGFASAFRGLSETEVRNFLRRVADEVKLVRDREDELSTEVEGLREQLRSPAPLTEQQLLDSLGEETARVLRSAQQAAEEIRSRAEERAATLVREAQEEATSLRDSAQAQATERTENAERYALERERAADAEAIQLREQAEAHATESRATAEAEAEAMRTESTLAAEAEIEAAKETGRGLVNEARTVRERVLADLGRRRALLQTQVDELRAGRDRLLDAYRVVKRSLGDATDALAQVEARANTEMASPASTADVPPVDDGPAAESNEPPRPVEGDPDQLDGPETGGSVDALFARLRAEKSEAQRVSESVGSPGEEVTPAVGAVAVAEAPDAPSDAEPVPDARAPVAKELVAEVPAAESPVAEESEPAPEPELEVQEDDEPEPSADDVLRLIQSELLAPATRELTRRAKRSLQDEQNEVLDRLRTVKKGRPSSEAVLPTAAVQQAAWIEVLRDPVGEAFTGGYTVIDGSGPAPAPDALVAELAQAMVDRLRERLVLAIDGAEDDDATTRLGARYREFKGQELEGALGDALAGAWARGTYEAAPAGALLRWIPAEVGRCPDCDDNALEPTRRGEVFPTGAPFPPAHPGCRCLLVVDVVSE